LTEERLRIIDRTAPNHREHGTQPQQLIEGTGDGIGALGYQVSEPVWSNRSTPLALPVELCAGCRV